MQLESILVPVDYSDCSRAALEYAGAIADRLGSSIEIVHVWDRPAYVSETVKVGPGDAARSLGELIRENAEAEMVQFMATVTLPPAVRVTTRLVAGNPAAAVLNELHEGKHQLLVVGTHGRTGLSHMLLGSVAEKLVRLSPVPVLTVPRAPSVREASAR